MGLRQHRLAETAQHPEPYDLELAWSHVWDCVWQAESLRKCSGNGGTSTNGNLAQLIANLDSDDHAVRVSASIRWGLSGNLNRIDGEASGSGGARR